MTIYLPFMIPEDVDKRIRHRKGVRDDNYQWSVRHEAVQMVQLLWRAYECGTSSTIGERSWEAADIAAFRRSARRNSTVYQSLH